MPSTTKTCPFFKRFLYFSNTSAQIETSILAEPSSRVAKAKEVLGWTPKTDFKKLVKNMVESDLALLDPKGWKQI